MPPQPFDTSALKTLPGVTLSSARNVQTMLTEDFSHRRKATVRTYRNALREKNVAKQLVALPEPGETIHYVTRGNWHAYDLVGAIIQLAAPRKVVELNIATLGFNQNNAEDLVARIDAGEIGRVTFLCSHFWRSHEGEVFAPLAEALEARGSSAASIRCHAKIIAFELDDGTGLVNEGSANLRTCSAIEQAALTNDRGLLDFHRSWMKEVL